MYLLYIRNTRRKVFILKKIKYNKEIKKERKMNIITCFTLEPKHKISSPKFFLNKKTSTNVQYTRII